MTKEKRSHKQAGSEIKTFAVPFDLQEQKENISISSNKNIENTQKQIINQAFKFHSQGNISEAARYYQHFINQGFKDHRVFSNYGIILEAQGKRKEAEHSYRKAIEFKPDYATAHLNLGNILKDLGKLKEAELSLLKAIELNPNFAEAHSNLGILLKDLGKLKEAERLTRKAIQINPDFCEGHSNLGIILNHLGRIKEAEKSTRKAIQINPDYEIAHSNLGSILIDMGKLEEAQLSLQKAIQINPYLAKPHCTLSILNPSTDNKKWQDILFSERILHNQQKKDLVDIFFARAYVSEEKCDFSQASDFLKKANNINRKIYGSNYSAIKLKIKDFYKDWKESKNDLNNKTNLPIPIFIVGMPRSGKTITESILACNNTLIKCGETPALEKAIKKYLSAEENSLNPSLYEFYIKNLELEHFGKSYICTTTPMNLIYTGLIASQIATAKIIYCYRNPLDNIKEIYKKNMGNKHTYSCSIIESTNLWLEVDSLMEKYRKTYSSKIYFLNYDNLVTNTEEEIKNLLCWLGWKNNDKYLKPSLDPKTRKISSRVNSKIINKNELSSWDNYQDLLKPAIEIINRSAKFKDIIK